MRSTIDQNQLSARTRPVDGLSRVKGDRVQLHQVVLNLILNSVEGMIAVHEGQFTVLAGLNDS